MARSTGRQRQRSPILAPLRQSAFQSPRVQPALSKHFDGLVRIDTVRTATIGDNLGVEIERRCDGFKFGERDILRTGNVAYRKLIRRPDIKKRDRTFLQSCSQFVSGDGFRGIQAIRQPAQDPLDLCKIACRLAMTSEQNIEGALILDEVPLK